MEWYLSVSIILGTLILLMLTGLPVAFCFILIDIVGALLWWGGKGGLVQLALSLSESVCSFSLLPLPMFVLMGEVLFHSGIAPRLIDAVDKWLGSMPGRLGLLAVGAGTLFSTLTGASPASIAMLGSTLVPEMERRGYKKPMSLGPILGSGGLAIMIPPSALAVFLGALAEISIGGILMAIIIPGILMAFLYATYIYLRCKFQPEIAPSYQTERFSLSEKISATCHHILPVGIVIFLVVGVIFLGIATPTEAAATGVLGSFILASIHKAVSWKLIKKSLYSTAEVSIMMFFVIAGAKGFGQILVFSGATRGLIEFTLGLSLPPMVIFVAMMIVVLILGMFMTVSTVIMISVPLYMPVVTSLHFDPVWFAVVYLVCIEVGTTSPPVGLGLFTMKGVAPPGTTMGEIYRAALPFIYCDLVAIVLIIVFPGIALWLPRLTMG